MLLSKLFYTKYVANELFLNDTLSNLYMPTILNKINHTEIKNAVSTNHPKVKLITIVKDIPAYLQIIPANKKLGVLTVRQYHGFLVNLSNCSDVTQYIEANLSKRNIKNLFIKQRKLEQNHQINYQVITGFIEKTTYNAIFDVFYTLLKERFKEKKTYNRYLPHWNALQEDCYDKILSKKASLHIVYDSNRPISITLNYHLDNITFSHIQAYDINYSHYNLGDISIYKQLEWCFLNNKTIFDLSMGKTDYKTKWCNETYTFYYHIFYRKFAVVPAITAFAIKMEFLTKQYLRDINLIGNKWSMDKIKYKLR